MLVGIALVAFVIFVELCAVRRWHGVWRWLAAVPLILMAVDALWILFDLSRNPDSHPLWQLELMLVGACAMPTVGFLWLAREIRT